MIPELWPHQEETRRRYEQHPQALLDLSDAGTGKTRGAIQAFSDRRRNGGKCALVVAPKTLLDSAWGEDISKFNPELSYSIAWAHNRAKAFELDVDVYITNPAASTWLAKQGKKFFDRFDTLIIDEISDFKHRTSQRSKAMRKICKHFKYRAGLTATPNSTSVTDIWHQALIIDDGELLGTNFWKFREAVCIPEIRDPRFPNRVEWRDRPGAVQAVAEILAPIVVRHNFEDVMPHVPEQTIKTVNYMPSQRLLALYERLKAEALLKVKEGEVDAVNAAALRTKLLQVASGSVYGVDGVITFDTGRTELVRQLISQRPHSIVFYNWEHQRDSMVEALDKAGISNIVLGRDTRDRGQVVRDFQDGQYQVMLMHPQTGAHGLTLTRATTVIWMSPNDRADLIKQGDARVRRGTQDKVTESIRICAKGTLEEQVFDNTERKLSAMDELMEILQ